MKVYFVTDTPDHPSGPHTTDQTMVSTTINKMDVSPINSYESTDDYYIIGWLIFIMQVRTIIQSIEKAKKSDEYYGTPIEPMINVMKTKPIYAQNSDLSSAWVIYLSNDGTAVLMSADLLESAGILSMPRIDTVIIFTNNSKTFLLFGKVFKSNKNTASIKLVTETGNSQLEFILGTNSFVTLALPFSSSKLKGVADTPINTLEVASNAFVLQSH